MDSLHKYLRGIGLAGATIFVSSACADTPAFVLESVTSNPPSSFTGTRGWQFGLLPTDDILITQLGVFDSGGDGLANPHEIGLWRDDPGHLTGTLLASATVPAGTDAPLIGGYRWVSISPVLIPHALASYVVGAQYSTGDADDTVTPHPSPFGPDIGAVPVNGRLAYASELTFPAAYTSPPSEGIPGERFFEPNLQYVVVPEPSVWFLLPGSLFWIFLRRRTPKLYN